MIKIEKYFADWCNPCRQLTPIINDVVEEFKNDVELVEMDIEVEREKTIENEVRSVPTVIIYDQDDKEYVRINGLNPKKEYVNVIRNILV